MRTHFIQRLTTIALLLPLFLITACTESQPEAPKSVVLLISDGTGVSHITALRYTSDSFAFSRMPVVGLFTTHSEDNRVTDSAASGTAFATGYKTNNHMLSVLPDSTTKPETLLEIAESEGKSTGLVATSQVTHATPAAFSSHVPSRYMEMEIARQQAAKDIEVLLGGGQQFYLQNDPAGNLIEQMTGNGYTYVETERELEQVDPSGTEKLIGLFAPKGMKPAKEGRMSLSLLTRKAVAILEKNHEGFFLMVEASQVDWEAHDNDTQGILVEMRDMNDALEWLLDYQQEHPDVLVVWVSDHETGGLSITGGSARDKSITTAFTVDHHTAQMIPLFAIGPGAEHFQGVYDNTDVGQKLINLLRNSR